MLFPGLLCSSKMRILLASGNPGKLKEIGEMSAGLPLQWGGLRDIPDFVMPEETGESFRDNALLKAGAACAYSGQVSLGEDSGLCVDALGGAPGIFSARYAGSHGDNQGNNSKLLSALSAVPDGSRGAHYACAMAVAFPAEMLVAGKTVPSGSELVKESEYLPQGCWAWLTQGKVVGEILRERRGEGGFGYDPLFYYPPFGQTFAEAPASAKHEVSHRAEALKRFFEWIAGAPLIWG